MATSPSSSSPAAHSTPNHPTGSKKMAALEADFSDLSIDPAPNSDVKHQASSSPPATSPIPPADAKHIFDTQPALFSLMDQNKSIESSPINSKHNRCSESTTTTDESSCHIDVFNINSSSSTTAPTTRKSSAATTSCSTTIRGRPSSCVFVASLAASYSDEHLCRSVATHFQKWGPLSVKVLRDSANRPYAFVQYTCDDHALAALREAQNNILDGRAIRCEPARVNRTLFISKFSSSKIDISEIRNLVSEYGEIEDMMMMNNQATHQLTAQNGAFVKFVYRDVAIQAYVALRYNSVWMVEWAQNIDHSHSRPIPSSMPIDKTSIFIGQLEPDRISKEILLARFSQYGKIVESNLVVRSGKDRITTIYARKTAFAFIRFSSAEEASLAVAHENRASFLGKTLRVQHREMHTSSQGQDKVPDHVLGSVAPPPNFSSDVAFAPLNYVKPPQVAQPSLAYTSYRPDIYQGMRLPSRYVNPQNPSQEVPVQDQPTPNYYYYGDPYYGMYMNQNELMYNPSSSMMVSPRYPISYPQSYVPPWVMPLYANTGGMLFNDNARTHDQPTSGAASETS